MKKKKQNKLISFLTEAVFIFLFVSSFTTKMNLMKKIKINTAYLPPQVELILY